MRSEIVSSRPLRNEYRTGRISCFDFSSLTVHMGSPSRPHHCGTLPLVNANESCFRKDMLAGLPLDVVT
jgi:hypothetical protein